MTLSEHTSLWMARFPYSLSWYKDFNNRSRCFNQYPQAIATNGSSINNKNTKGPATCKGLFSLRKLSYRIRRTYHPYFADCLPHTDQLTYPRLLGSQGDHRLHKGGPFFCSLSFSSPIEPAPGGRNSYALQSTNKWRDLGLSECLPRAGQSREPAPVYCHIRGVMLVSPQRCKWWCYIFACTGNPCRLDMFLESVSWTDLVLWNSILLCPEWVKIRLYTRSIHSRSWDCAARHISNADDPSQWNGEYSIFCLNTCDKRNNGVFFALSPEIVKFGWRRKPKDAMQGEESPKIWLLCTTESVLQKRAEANDHVRILCGKIIVNPNEIHDINFESSFAVWALFRFSPECAMKATRSCLDKSELQNLFVVGLYIIER